MKIQLRIKNNLEEVLSAGVSSPWKINHERLTLLMDVEIINFNGTAKIIGTFDLDRTRILRDGKRVAIAFQDAKIEYGEFKWVGFNPICYKMSDN